jgi:hypothetical protein
MDHKVIYFEKICFFGTNDKEVIDFNDFVVVVVTAASKNSYSIVVIVVDSS